jgi:DNA-binding MarR family transcriptional regulator
MEAAGWIRRQPSETDRRVNEVVLQPQAMQALEQAIAVSDTVTAQALAGMSAADQKRLTDLLRQAHANLASPADDKATE